MIAGYRRRTDVAIVSPGSVKDGGVRRLSIEDPLSRCGIEEDRKSRYIDVVADEGLRAMCEHGEVGRVELHLFDRIVADG